MDGISVNRRLDGPFESGVLILVTVLPSVRTCENGFIIFLKSVHSSGIGIAGGISKDRGTKCSHGIDPSVLFLKCDTADVGIVSLHIEELTDFTVGKSLCQDAVVA